MILELPPPNIAGLLSVSFLPTLSTVKLCLQKVVLTFFFFFQENNNLNFAFKFHPPPPPPPPPPKKKKKKKNYFLKNNITSPILRVGYKFMPNLTCLCDLEYLGYMVLIFRLSLSIRDGHFCDRKPSRSPNESYPILKESKCDKFVEFFSYFFLNLI